MRMITIDVQGHGSFVVHASKLNELISWLTQNSMQVEVNKRPIREDDTLLNG